MREHEVKLRLDDDELARLDANRPAGIPRAVYLRNRIRELSGHEDIATLEEVLALLSEQARAGKVAAAIALERALRNAPPEGVDDDFDEALAELLDG